jgi:hypothetical protein
VILGFAATVRADLMPMSYSGDSVCGERSSSGWSGGGALVVNEWLVGLNGLDALSIDTAGVADEGKVEHHSVQIVVDRSKSFDLCLYALISLGVFRSCHWVKRSSPGLIPEWYHSGAARQIGYSYAVGPDASCFAAVCFIQPDHTVNVDTTQHRPGTIMALWRCSQFTPCVLASRGPPPVS